MKNNERKIKLERKQKAFMLKVLHDGFYTYSDLVEAFPESVREQPLFPDIEKAKSNAKN